jgi:hypothetical protein
VTIHSTNLERVGVTHTMNARAAPSNITGTKKAGQELNPPLIRQIWLGVLFAKDASGAGAEKRRNGMLPFSRKSSREELRTNARQKDETSYGNTLPHPRRRLEFEWIDEPLSLGLDQLNPVS